MPSEHIRSMGIGLQSAERHVGVKAAVAIFAALDD